VNRTASESVPSGLAQLGYDADEAALVARVAGKRGLPLLKFAADLMAASVHETGHHMMIVWLGGEASATRLSLTWPEQRSGRMVEGQSSFSGLPEWTSSRRAVAVAGPVAEWMMREHGGGISNEWDLYAKLREDGGMPASDLDLAEGRITWHAVKRAARLLRRHWNIIRLSAASKRRDLLFRLSEQAPDVHSRPGPEMGLRSSARRLTAAYR
jgi:hypothetical protein